MLFFRFDKNSIAERLKIIKLYFIKNQCARLTATLFIKRHADKHIHHGYILDLVAKFREAGSVANKKRNIENPVKNEAVEVGVLGEVSMNPTLSTRKLSHIKRVSRTTVQRILKHNKWHPYKIQLL